MDRLKYIKYSLIESSEVKLKIEMHCQESIIEAINIIKGWT